MRQQQIFFTLLLRRTLVLMDIPQRPSIDFNIPKRRVRASALLIDFLIIMIANIVVFKFWSVEQEDGTYLVSGMPAMLLLAFVFFYLVIPEMITGRTLGKSLAGIKVISQDGADASPKQVILRHLLDIIEFFGFFLVFFIVISNNKKRLRIGDMIANTIVIQENSNVS